MMARTKKAPKRQDAGQEWPDFERLFGVSWPPSLPMWRSILASHTDGEFSNAEIVNLTANGVPELQSLISSRIVDGPPISIRIIRGGDRYNQKHRIGDYSPTTTSIDASPDRRSLEAKALALFIEDKTRTKKQIAAILSCHEKSLSPKRCPHLAASIAAYKAPHLPSGFKDGDGNIEAWDAG